MVESLPLGRLDGSPFEILDRRFEAAILPDEGAERLWTGGRWVEGPAWLAASRALVWSDIPSDRMLAWDEVTGETRPFRAPSNGANGNTVDRQGRLVTCEQYTRRITRTDPDGTITVLAERFEGKRFNAPNDIVVKSDGSVWFTDPNYGKSPLYEGTRELSGCHVYRLDPRSGEVRQMTTDFVMPNGLAFSPDESRLYIVDTGSTHINGGPNHVRRFHVGFNDALSGGEIIAVNVAEKFDGFRARLPRATAMDGRGGWRPVLLPRGRHADRQNAAARAGLEPDLRRGKSRSPSDDGLYLDLRHTTRQGTQAGAANWAIGATVCAGRRRPDE